MGGVGSGARGWGANMGFYHFHILPCSFHFHIAISENLFFLILPIALSDPDPVRSCQILSDCQGFTRERARMICRGLRLSTGDKLRLSLSGYGLAVVCPVEGETGAVRTRQRTQKSPDYQGRQRGVFCRV